MAILKVKLLKRGPGAVQTGALCERILSMRWEID
jgi:hypothetical protein